MSGKEDDSILAFDCKFGQSVYIPIRSNAKIACAKELSDNFKCVASKISPEELDNKDLFYILEFSPLATGSYSFTSFGDDFQHHYIIDVISSSLNYI